MVLVEIRRARSLDQRLELGRRIVDIRTEVLNGPKGRYSSNSLSTPGTKSSVKTNGLKTGRLRRLLAADRRSRGFPHRTHDDV